VKLAKDSQVQESKAARSSTDSWTSGDKRAHFLGGLVISGLVTNYTDSATAGVLSGCGVAVAGELDRRGAQAAGTASTSAPRTFAAGCLGGVVAGFAGVYIAPNRIVWSRQF
jgi:hypothetical protein